MNPLYLVAHVIEGEGVIHFDVVSADGELAALMRVLKMDELPTDVATVGDLLDYAFDAGIVIGARLMRGVGDGDS